MVISNKAIFFDRDGVLIEAPVNKQKKPLSVKKVDEVKICEGVEEICKKYRHDFYLIMITNQPDLQRKKNTKKNIENINLFIKKKLNLNDIFVCYSDDEECFYRKPNPGMLIDAKKKYNIEFNNSYFIGDRWRDIDAGKKIGCKTIFIDRMYNEKLNFKPDYVVKDMKQILKII